MPKRPFDFSDSQSGGVANLSGPDDAAPPILGENAPGNDMPTFAETQLVGAGLSAGQPVGTIAQLADYLVNGFWSASGALPHHWASNTISYNLGNLSAGEQSLAMAALADWQNVANITFVQTSGAANISFNHNGTMAAVTNASWDGSGHMMSASVDISSDWIANDGGAMDGRTGIYSYGFQTYIHEIGHALGLGHQGPYNGSATYGTSNVYANDTWQYSVMSYFPQSNFGGSYDYVITPQMADITAVQSIYGAANFQSGNTIYGFHSTAGSIYDFSQYAGLGTPAFTIYDSGGNDTLDCSGYSQNAAIDLTPGAFCSVGGFTNDIGISSTTVIENAIGGLGADNIMGNSADNVLIGGGGNDTLNGGGGTNTAVYSGLRADYLITQNADGSIHIVDARAGSPDGTDNDYNIQLFQFNDGTLSVNSLFDHPPVITSSNITATTAGQVFAASSLVSASDPDGDPLVSYSFWDSTPGGGYFDVNGVVQNTQFIVSAAQLSQVHFHAGPHGSTDHIYANVSDGTLWGSPTQFDVTGPDSRPVITSSNVQATAGVVLAASSLFSASDPDGDAIVSYAFMDATSGGGYFDVNGVIQPANQVFYVSPAQLAQTHFHAGPAGSSDNIFATAFDGVLWAGTQFTVSVPLSANHPPVITSSNVTATTAGQVFAASSLVSASDPDGDAIVSYAFMDGTPGGGYFDVNGVIQSANQVFYLSPAQLAQTHFHAGAGGSSDSILATAFDGALWAGTQFNVSVPLSADHPPVITSSNVTATTAGQVFAASSLVSASDPDGDTIVSYAFMDGTPGGGYFDVNGVIQSANQVFYVSQAQLAQTHFHAGAVGSSDHIFATASDGVLWAGTQFNVMAPTSSMPTVATASTVGASLGEIPSGPSGPTASNNAADVGPVVVTHPDDLLPDAHPAVPSFNHWHDSLL